MLWFASPLVSPVTFSFPARLQLGPAGSAKWFVISDPLQWRVEFHFKKLPLTELIINNGQAADFNHDNQTDNHVITELEMQQVGINDANGDGQVAGDVGYWDDDPLFGSFAQPDNAGLPA